MGIGYMYCQYTINAPAGKRIRLVFQELNLAFTDQGDFIEVWSFFLFTEFFKCIYCFIFHMKTNYNQVVDKSPGNYGKVLATFNAGDGAMITSGESMFIYFEANPGGYTKNGKAAAWRAAYHVVENVEKVKSSVIASAESHPYIYGLAMLFCFVFFCSLCQLTQLFSVSLSLAWTHVIGHYYKDSIVEKS